jgi:hypothetical protein
MEDKMEKDIENFLHAEESAEKLIQTLERLQTEAKSYQGATNEIGIARDKLLELIGSTKDVVNNSYEVIKTLKGIGGPEIFERFNKIENKLNEGSEKIESKIEEVSNQQSSRIKSLKFFVIILLLISLATIAGLVFPNYLAELNNFIYNIFR